MPIPIQAQSSGGSIGQGVEGEAEGYDISVQMEGDTAYNAEEAGEQSR